ncbi:MAG TPA: peptide-methionine (S)-S-oxide reductase MsrA [Candidatus Binatia bacterium]|nr:peptide-methionine (S)-S-oxide reductase MsrA [Candidatus Binatia bacterium]
MKTFLLALGLLAALPVAAETRTAYFAGGCFWCMESDFEKLPGVLGVASGYTGGKEQNPTYEQVSSHGTGHAEAVEVSYDSAKVGYPQLLDWFWHHVDPLTADAQFCDAGHQYRSAIFYRDEAEKSAALDSKARFGKQLGKPIVTEIVAAGRFWPAEEYHQDYYKKNPIRYNYYRHACGRDARVREVWGKDSH